MNVHTRSEDKTCSCVIKMVLRVSIWCRRRNTCVAVPRKPRISSICHFPFISSVTNGAFHISVVFNLYTLLPTVDSTFSCFSISILCCQPEILETPLRGFSFVSSTANYRNRLCIYKNFHYTQAFKCGICFHVFTVFRSCAFLRSAY